MMNYKGYGCTIRFDDEADIFHGEVTGLRDVVTFQGRTVDEVKSAFRESIDDYLDFCASRGETPDKPYSGRFLLRVDPTLHRRLVELSTDEGESLNNWIASRLLDCLTTWRTYRNNLMPTKRWWQRRATSLVRFALDAQSPPCRRATLLC